MTTTYLGSDTLRAQFLAQIRSHEEQDALIKGTYGRMNGTFKGCAIGCSLASLNVLQGKPIAEQTDRHQRLVDELGWPLWLAYLEDHLFERLPDDLARTWPRRLAEAIPVGGGDFGSRAGAHPVVDAGRSGVWGAPRDDGGAGGGVD